MVLYRCAILYNDVCGVFRIGKAERRESIRHNERYGMVVRGRSIKSVLLPITSRGGVKMITCPKCKSLSVTVTRSKPRRTEHKCETCGHRWRVKR